MGRPEVPEKEIHKLDKTGEFFFYDRYALHAEETWEDACWRWSYNAAMAETGELVDKWGSRFYKETVTNRFIPGGRIMRSLGRPLQATGNCFVIGTSDIDSREGWGQTLKELLIISGEGGGVGFNGSEIRPRGSMVKRTDGVATGPVSFFRMMDSVAKEIRGGGARRAAMLLVLNDDHPDLLEFVNAKVKHGELENANISIGFTEDIEEFLKKDTHHLKWQDETLKEVKPDDIWKKFIHNTFTDGDPGFLNLYLINKMNNLWYCREIKACNPCGELPLESYGVCNLGNIVLPKFVNRNSTDLRWEELADTITTAVRFLDNIIDVAHYPLRKIREEMFDTRRIGLGITGLGTMFLQMGIKYDSDEALAFASRLMKFIKHKAYRASVYLAVEKGQFPLLDREKFIQSGFCKKMKPSIQREILEYGIRNCTLLTIPPHGTGSMIAGVTSGVESLFSIAIKRKSTTLDDKAGHEEIILNDLYKEALDKGEDTSYFQGAIEISPEKHFEMQIVLQEHIDSAISKTVWLPKDYTEKELDSLFRKYLPQVKGVTVYRLGSKKDEPLTPISIEEALQMSCPNGSCEL